MEARESFRETAVSKGVAVLVGLCVAAGMGVAGAFVAADLTGLKAAPASHKSVVTSGIPDGSGATYSTHRGGTQFVDEAPAAVRAATPKPHGYT